jgi:hypothetical protein
MSQSNPKRMIGRIATFVPSWTVVRGALKSLGGKRKPRRTLNG